MMLRQVMMLELKLPDALCFKTMIIQLSGAAGNEVLRTSSRCHIPEAQQSRIRPLQNKYEAPKIWGLASVLTMNIDLSPSF
jgi:hypothetical protein